jgi:hypothetical protein
MRNPWAAEAGVDFVSSMLPGTPAISVEGVGAVAGTVAYDLVK